MPYCSDVTYQIKEEPLKKNITKNITMLLNYSKNFTLNFKQKHNGKLLLLVLFDAPRIQNITKN